MWSSIVNNRQQLWKTVITGDTVTRLSIPIRGRNVGARGVMVIVVGNGHGDTSSNPGRDLLHFT